MAEQERDPIQQIKSLLEVKSTAKQITYKNLLKAFHILADESQRIIGQLKTSVIPGDDDVTIEYTVVNTHEFHVKLAGDLLIFVLHTNVVAMDTSHPVMQDPYMKEKEVNRYFGQIMIYNFMADSLKFNRINDPGYLLARLLINHEGRYVIEGDGHLATIANKISTQPIVEDELGILVKLALMLAIENDLVAPAFPDVRYITLFQKMERTLEMGAGRKIGFQITMSGKN
jgi:hypothetical protein